MSATQYKKGLLALVILLSFGGSISNRYSLDDEYVTTTKNTLVSKGFSGIKEILTSPYSIDETENSYGYRPVTMMSFAIEYSLFKFNPRISHFINVLFYMSIVLLVFKVLQYLFSTSSSWTLFTICLLFAMHPLHSEVVLSLKNREELLVALFGFLTFYYTFLYFEKKKVVYGIYVFLLIIIGLNTKLTFLPFLLFIPITLWYLKRINLKQGGILLFVFCIVSMLGINLPYLFLQEENLSRTMLYFENPMASMSLLERVPNSLASFFIYAKLHLFPSPLLSYYGYPHIDVSSWSNYKVYLGIIILITVGFTIYKTKHKLIGFGLFTFLIFMLPYANFIMPPPGIIAERFTFSSVLGSSTFLVTFIIWLLEKQIQKKPHFNHYVGVVILVSIALIIVNRHRTQDWKTALTLIRADVKKAPNSTKLHLLHGDLAQERIAKANNEKKRQRYANEAINAYQNAIDLYPTYPTTYNNLGVIYSTIGNYKKAIPFLEKAIALGNHTALNYYNLGACYELLGEIQKAKDYYTKALAEDQNFQLALDRLKELNNVH